MRMHAAAIALAVPVSVLAGARCVALVLAAFGHHPMWPEQGLNLSEAAGSRDLAEVVRLVEQGEEDLNAVREIRSGLLFDHPVRLKPIEAAVEAGDPVMVSALIRLGVVLDAGSWNRLRCGTERVDVIAALDANRPGGAEIRCAAVASEPAP